MFKIFLYVAVANLLDGVFSFIGLQFHFITESNTMMDAMYHQSPLLFLLSKITLSLCLFFLASKLRSNRKVILNLLARFAALAYSFVIVLHAIWIVQLF